MSDHDDIKVREFTRNEIHIHATVRSEYGPDIQGQTRVLSMNGVFVESECALPVDSHCHVTLTLGDGETHIDVEASVAHVYDDGLALAFEEMEPESFQHLRRLVLYNARDLNRVEEELENHVGFKTRIHP